MISKEKKDYKVGSVIYIIITHLDHFSIQEVLVEKIGSKYMYLSNKHKYEFGDDCTTYKCSSKDWITGYYLESLFTDKSEAEKEAYKRDLARRIENNFRRNSIGLFLKSINVKLLEDIAKELKIDV